MKKQEELLNELLNEDGRELVDHLLSEKDNRVTDVGYGVNNRNVTNQFVRFRVRNRMVQIYMTKNTVTVDVFVGDNPVIVRNSAIVDVELFKKMIPGCPNLNQIK